MAIDRSAHPLVFRYGTTTPEWMPEDADTPETYASSNGEASATMNARPDGLGYCIETWNESVGLTTFWTTTDYAAGVAFVDAATPGSADFAGWDAPESEEDYALACDAMHAANPSRLEGEL